MRRLWRCEHFYNLCQTPSAGSIFCKPAGPGSEKKKRNLVKAILCCTVYFLKCQTFLWCPRSSASKKVNGKCETSRKRFDVIQPRCLSFFLLMLQRRVLFLDQWINPAVSLRTFLQWLPNKNTLNNYEWLTKGHHSFNQHLSGNLIDDTEGNI